MPNANASNSPSPALVAACAAALAAGQPVAGQPKPALLQQGGKPYSPRGNANGKLGSAKNNYVSWGLCTAALTAGPLPQPTLVALLTYLSNHTCFVGWRIKQGGLVAGASGKAPTANMLTAVLHAAGYTSLPLFKQ